jgi:hypothetical protein
MSFHHNKHVPWGMSMCGGNVSIGEGPLSSILVELSSRMNYCFRAQKKSSNSLRSSSETFAKEKRESQSLLEAEQTPIVDQDKQNISTTPHSDSNMTNKEDMQDLLAKINAPNQTFNPSQLSM